MQIKSATTRTIGMRIAVPFMKLTGFRFSKEYRWAESGFKAWIYAHVDTVAANIACTYS